MNGYLSVAPDLVVYPWYTDQSSDQVKCHKLFSMKSLKKPTKRCVTKQSSLSHSSYSVLAHTPGTRPYNYVPCGEDDNYVYCSILAPVSFPTTYKKIYVVMFNFMITT